MTRGPRRLLDDPEFKWETGCDLADERRALGEPDLSLLRQRVLAQIPVVPPDIVGDGIPSVRPTSPWSSWVRPGAGLASAAAVVGAAYYLGTGYSGPSGGEARPDVPPPPPVVAPAETAPADLGGAELVGSAVLQVPVRAGRPEPSVGADSRGARIDLNEPPAATLVLPPFPASEQAIGVTGPSAAKAQTEAYDSARDALARKQYREAIDRFDALRNVPNGLFVAEASLLELETLLTLGDAGATLELIDRIQGQPALLAKQDELTRLRAESLVMLGRCEEALPVSETLSSKTASEIRRACRQRKETPP